MSTLNYVVGDACSPIGTGPKIIAHVCNDLGAWGRGFVLTLSRKWSEPETAYRSIPRSQLVLGDIMYQPVANDTAVVNMIAQHGLRSQANPQPLDYYALLQCLMKLRDCAVSQRATVHMPRIGAGLAGGDWTTIEGLIDAALLVNNIDVVVYDLPVRR